MGYFRAVADMPDIFNSSFTGAELQKWPLMHGTWVERQVVDKICVEGLRAGSKENSFPYDDALGRSDWVFLSTASFRFNYGNGLGFLIDPAILTDADVVFSYQDIGEAYRYVLRTIRGEQPDARHVIEPAILDRIINKVYIANESEYFEHSTVRVMRSDQFLEYYKQHYSIAQSNFFTAIEDTARGRSWTLFYYFNRTLWPLSEEIRTHIRIKPDFLLGYWNGSSWEEWKTAKEPQTRRLVQQWIQLRMRLRELSSPMRS